METQKVILPFFYALFLPDLPWEDKSDSLLPSKEAESHLPSTQPVSSQGGLENE